MAPGPTCLDISILSDFSASDILSPLLNVAFSFERQSDFDLPEQHAAQYSLLVLPTIWN
jgi:hypothetical protein